jgi:centrin-1
VRALGFELKKEEIKHIFDELDKDLNQEVTLEEFVKMMTPRMGDRDSREEIEKVFKLFDEDNTGYITFRNLKKICNDLGENLNDDEIQEMIDEADRDNDGKVSGERR